MYICVYIYNNKIVVTSSDDMCSPLLRFLPGAIKRVDGFRPGRLMPTASRIILSKDIACSHCPPFLHADMAADKLTMTTHYDYRLLTTAYDYSLLTTEK